MRSRLELSLAEDSINLSDFSIMNSDGDLPVLQTEQGFANTDGDKGRLFAGRCLRGGRSPLGNIRRRHRLSPNLEPTDWGDVKYQNLTVARNPNVSVNKPVVIRSPTMIARPGDQARIS